MGRAGLTASSVIIIPEEEPVKKKRIYFSAFGLTFAVLLILFITCGYAPFGNKSLAVDDASIQYLDFYAYFKDVLAQKNSIFYTFGKTLGGTNIAVFSYYLSSPFMLLSVFFPKENLHSFFDILVLLKLSLASMTFSIFLVNRFRKYLTENTESARTFFVVLLSCCYGLCQYTIAQSSNIMWIDGVYLLPLILLGTYQIIHGSSIWKLSVWVALSILFNWYSGGINCVFSALWFLFELALYFLGSSRKYSHIPRKALVMIFRYGLSMFLGLMCSAVLFLPTVLAMGNSNRGSLDLAVLKDFSFVGQLPTILESYHLGAHSTPNSTSLFCGTLVILAVIALFLSSTLSAQKKSMLACFLAVIALIFYWKPFYMVFSLFKTVESYWCRYSYVGIAALIFLAACFYLIYLDDHTAVLLSRGWIIFSVLLFFLDNIHPGEHTSKIYLTVFYAAVTLISVRLFMYSRNFKSWKKAVITLLCTGIILSELAVNASFLMNDYHADENSQYTAYSLGSQKQIGEIKESDSSIYRISQTSTKIQYTDGATANYNEALAYNYRSISGYTSSPDDTQREFLERIGYRENGLNMNITNSPVIAADALLGVKYTLSAYPVNGLTKLDSIEAENGKSVYCNPSALPMAFLYHDNSESIQTPQTDDPFVYQNYLYSILCGHPVSLYRPLSYTCSSKGDSDSGTDQVYTLSVPEGNYALYGNIPWDSPMENASLNVNDSYISRYSWWLSPSAFYIPAASEAAYAKVSIHSDNGYFIRDGGEQFYALDLDALAAVSKEISGRAVEEFQLENGHVSVSCTAADSSSLLYLSIPYDKGWKIYRNGQQITAGLLDDCMYSIPLTEGKNQIELRYICPGIRAGILLSVSGILLTLLISLFEHKNRLQKNKL